MALITKRWAVPSANGWKMYAAMLLQQLYVYLFADYAPLMLAVVKCDTDKPIYTSL